MSELIYFLISKPPSNELAGDVKSYRFCELDPSDTWTTKHYTEHKHTKTKSSSGHEVIVCFSSALTDREISSFKNLFFHSYFHIGRKSNTCYFSDDFFNSVLPNIISSGGIILYDFKFDEVHVIDENGNCVSVYTYNSTRLYQSKIRLNSSRNFNFDIHKTKNFTNIESKTAYLPPIFLNLPNDFIYHMITKIRSLANGTWIQ